MGLCVIVKHHDAGLASLSIVVFVLLSAILYLSGYRYAVLLRLHEDRFSLERALVNAVTAKTFSVNYQPVVRIHDKKL
jgi:sensor c-di-GMP phosphodiesterase-like protein